MPKQERYFGGHGAYTLILTNMTKSDAVELAKHYRVHFPTYSLRSVKESNGKYSIYRREWKQTTKKQKDAAYTANRASVEKMNKSFRKDLPPWSD